MNVIKATVIVSDNGFNDAVEIETDLPSASEFVYAGGGEKIVLSFMIKKGFGVEYVKKNFALIPEVVKSLI